MLPSGLCGHHVGMWYIDIHAGKTPTHINENLLKVGDFSKFDVNNLGVLGVL